MAKTRQYYVNELVRIAFKIDDKAKAMHDKTERLKQMANLSKQGLKESEEFKQLDQEFRHPTVTDFGDELDDLQKVVKHLRRYKFNSIG